jgi:hypothetical protein
MPARVYRVHLWNGTDFKLARQNHHLCHGDWTPGGWEPPPVIESKSVAAAWQSESAGVGTGTEGWVKYKLTSGPSGQDIGEQAYIHWQVPYIGTGIIPGAPPPTGGDLFDASSAQVSSGDVTPHCDADSSGGGSAFEEAKHELIFLGLGRPAGDLTLGEMLADLTNPVSWIADFLSSNDPWDVTLLLRQKGSVRQSVSLPPPGEKNIRHLAKQANTLSIRQLLRV